MDRTQENTERLIELFADLIVQMVMSEDKTETNS